MSRLSLIAKISRGSAFMWSGPKIVLSFTNCFILQLYIRISLTFLMPVSITEAFSLQQCYTNGIKFNPWDQLPMLGIVSTKWSQDLLILHSFLLPNRILLSWCTIICLFIVYQRYLGSFLFKAIVSRISIKMHVQVLYEHLHWMLCGTHSKYKVVFFSQMVGVCWCNKRSTCFLNEAITFHSHGHCMSIPVAPHVHSTSYQYVLDLVTPVGWPFIFIFEIII